MTRYQIHYSCSADLSGIPVVSFDLDNDDIWWAIFSSDKYITWLELREEKKYDFEELIEIDSPLY